MPQYINTNVMSINTVRVLDKSQHSLQTSMERLSSGQRINHSRDDAAGLAISEGMTSQIRGMNQAVRNTMDGISLVQTADGALGGITEKLQRVRELAVQSSNGTNSSNDRTAIDKEVQALLKEVDRVADSLKFNGVKLIDGSFTSQAFQVGYSQGDTITISKVSDANVDALDLVSATATSSADITAGNITAATTFTITGSNTGATASTITLTADSTAAEITAAINAAASNTGVVAKLSGAKISLYSGGTFTIADGSGTTASNAIHITGAQTEGSTYLNVQSVGEAEASILAVDQALTTLNTARAELGAYQNRFESTVSDLKNNVENLSSARSRIQDADFAEETASLAKNQILQQAGMAMLSQANQLPQNVLKLLQ